MNEPKTPVNFPSIQVARCIGYDAEHNSILIQLPSGQSPALFARMLYKGNADQYRIEQEPLPLVGTWGVVAFPGNDDRFPIWLGSYYPNITDAITSSPVFQDSQIKYFSHYSGYYSKLDGQGNVYVRLPEGTNFIANVNNTPPVTFRHIFTTDVTGDPEYPQARVELPDSERVPTPPPVFFLSINHPSGALTSCNPLGLIIWQAGNPQLASWTITPSGVATLQTGVNGGPGVQTGPTAVWDGHLGLITITGANGNSSQIMTVSGAVTITAAKGESSIVMDPSGQVTINAGSGGSQIFMDKNGNVTVTAQENITIQAQQEILVQSQGSAVTVEANGGDIYVITDEHADSIDNIINTYNNHTHSDVTNGQDDTGPPNPPLLP